MPNILGYDTEETPLYESDNSRVWRVPHGKDGKPVILKVLAKAFPTLQEWGRFGREYKIASGLKNVDGVIKVFDLQEIKTTRAIIMEDGGEDLAQYLLHHQLELEEFLGMGIQIAGALGHIHQRGPIHKDINPSNLVRHPETGKVQIIDFGNSAELPREQPNIQPPKRLEGTLAYIAPEQTGRMNRAIDYRTDLYSLGVTFYEMLTGQLPFQGENDLEIVRCHLVKKPRPPHEIQEVPEVLSDIIIKLMEKEAEKRYQSAFGLLHDLKECQKRLKEHGTISQFLIGQNDRPEHFRIPQKLYGREQEREKLLRAFDRVRNGAAELMLVAGHKGIGKSTLVNELRRPIVEKHGYFISGKCTVDEQGTIPYSTFIQAFTSLIDQRLYGSIENWKKQLLDALGTNAQVIINEIPKLKSIIGAQPDILKLSTDKEKYRLLLTFQNFVQACASAEHPLVLVLDDLQWADRPSLNLLKQLVIDPTTRYILFVGIYRDDKVDDRHPLMKMLKAIKKSGKIPDSISLRPLHTEEANTFIADTLRLPPERCTLLTELLHQRTQGNPFFLWQYVQDLHEKELIKFNQNDGTVEWDLEKIRRVEIPNDDMAMLMVNKLKNLPPETQKILTSAACIGYQFDLRTLARVSQKSVQETFRNLKDALKGLIVPLDDTYKYLEIDKKWKIDSETLDDFSLNPHFKFLHDQVQQAAYELTEENKKGLHLRIGRLLSQTSQTEQEKKLVQIANHLNLGRDLIIDQLEKEDLARINLRAGIKIKIPYPQQAFEFFKIGLELLGTQSWEHQYDLTLALHVEAAETAYLSGKSEDLERFVTSAKKNAESLLDKIRIYEIEIQAYIARGRLQEAIQSGLQALELLEIHLEEPENLCFEVEQSISPTGRIQDLLRKQSVEAPEIKAAIGILMELTAATFIAAPNFMYAVVFEGVKLSAIHGNAPSSSPLYAVYGTVLCGEQNQNIQSGYEYGVLSLELVQRPEAKEFEPRVLLVFYNFIYHWKASLRDALPFLKRAYELARNNGDFLFFGFSAFLYCYNAFVAGIRLADLKERILKQGRECQQLKQGMALQWIQGYGQTVLNLIGKSADPCSLVGEQYDEQKMLLQHSEADDKTGLYHLYANKMFLCYLFWNYREALEYACEAEEYLSGVRASAAVPFFRFYDSLIRLALYPDVSEDDQQDFRKRVAANQEKMKIWADHAPMNYEHKWCLVEAERARVLKKFGEAIPLYIQAFRGARKQGYVQEEALAYELMAQYYFDRNMKPEFRARMAKAIYCYNDWGATAKIQHLLKIYPEELRDLIYESEVVRHSYKNQRVPKPKTTTILSGTLDKSTVKKSREFSQEIQEDFLPKMMQVIMENAGAQKGVYIERSDNQWMIRAEADGRTGANDVCDQLVDNSEHVPHSIIYYVINNQTEIMLNDASTDSNFESDSYIHTYAPKSVLCLPVENRGIVKAVVYLENAQTVGAFSPERLELLKLLSAQICMSLENSRQYQRLTEYSQQWKEYSETLEQEVAGRTAELQEQKKMLEQKYEDLQKQAEALEQKNKELQQANEEAEQAQNEFIAVMSHDLRTPLNTIRSTAQNLLRELEQHEKLREKAAVINTTCDNLTNQINDILDQSKIRAGRSKLEIERFDLFSMLEDVIRMIKAKAEQKHLILRHTRSRFLPQYVYGDANRLERILINLLDNAIKYTQEGQIIFRVTRYRETRDDETVDDKIRFEIEDTGVGISPEKVGIIFQPYEQLHDKALPSVKANIYRGVGLGLSIARQFTRLMGSEIICESEEGKGSIFRFEVELPETRECRSFPEDASLQDSFESQEIAGTYVPTVSSQDLSRDLLKELLQSANNSNITNIRKTLVKIQHISENHNLRSFCTKIEQLADNFQFEKISEIVETVIKGAE